MSEPLTLRNMQRDLTTEGMQLRAETLNEKERSVEAVLSTNARSIVYDPETDRLIEEILVPDGAEYPDQLPLLESHCRLSTLNILGSIRNIRVEGDKLVGRLYFAKGDVEADRAWNKVRQGHITDVSICYRAVEYVDIKPGTTRVVNGTSYTAGARTLRVTSRYKVREGSLVAIGADEAAKIRAERNLPRENVMNKQLRAYLETIGLRKDVGDTDAWAFYNGLSGEQQTRAKAILDESSRVQPSNPPSDPQQTTPQQPVQVATATVTPPAAPQVDAEAIRRAERERIEMCRSSRVEGVPDDLVARAISEGWDETRVNSEYLQAVRANRSPSVGAAPAAHVRDHERDCNRDALAAGIMGRCNIDPSTLCRSEQDRRQWEQRMNQGEVYQHYSLMDIVRECVRIDGSRTPDGMHPVSREDFIRAALSTPTLGYAFTTSVNAQVLGAYEEGGKDLPFVETVDVSNFKTHEVISLGKGTRLEPLPRGKTAKHTTFSDEQETYRVHRFAQQFAVDEQDIIDDNFDVFNSVAPEMGMRAASVATDMIYYLLMCNSGAGPTMADGNALFSSAHDNNGSTALGADGAALKDAISAMRMQKQDGVSLDIRPQFLIVAPKLQWIALELLKGTQIVIGGTAGEVTQRVNYNALSDMTLTVVTNSRLGNGVTDPLTGDTASGADTKWFLASRPFRTLRLAYMAGTGRRPQLRRYVFDRGRWGIGWDIKLDVGAAAIGYRGLYRGNT